MIQDAFKNNSGLEKGSAFKEYARVVESKNPVEDSSDKQEKDALKEFFLLALWKLENEHWKCYRVFKVDDLVSMK